MFTPYISGYGCGWEIFKAKNNDKIVYHTGRIPGYISYIIRDVNKKYVVIVLINDDLDDKQLFSVGRSLLQSVEGNNNIL